MKKFKTDIIIFAGLLILAWIIVGAYIGNTALDIQLHDTYFVIDRVSTGMLIVGPLTLLIFFVRALTRKFKTIGTNMGLAIGLILVAFITYEVIRLQQHYLASVMQPDDDGFPDRGQFIADLKNSITWSCVLFSFWIVALALLIFRTIRIWKERHGIAR